MRQLMRMAGLTILLLAIISSGVGIAHADQKAAMEALQNIGRHAAATAVEVELDMEGPRAQLRVRDDGGGFDPREGTNRLGLKGMAERARLVGGELDVRSAPGGGTTVTLRIQ